MKKFSAFTIIEVIFVIALLAILITIVYIAFDPPKMFARARDAKRENDISAIGKAISQYRVDNNGELPLEIGQDFMVIGKSKTACNVNCAGFGYTGGTGVSTGGTESHSISFQDSLSFASGTYLSTFWNSISNGISLNSAGQIAGSGTYASAVYDANVVSSWSTILFTPRSPYGKELLNSRQIENSYSVGNTNMTGNVLLFHMNETSGGVVDSSGTGNNGAVSGGVIYNQTGKFNNALQFNGTNGYISVPNSPTLNPTSAITVSAWVKWNITPTSGNGWATIVNKNSDSQYRLQHNSNNTRFEFAIVTSGVGGVGRYITSTTVPQIGRWYYLVGTYDGTTVRLYVNGVQESTVGLTGTINTSTAPLYISNHPGRFFNGLIDEVSIYNRALSASEINDNYLRGVMRMKFQVKTCALGDCSDSQFVGPDGSSASYFSENVNNSLTFQPISLSFLANNRYFQYKVIFETDSPSYTPQLDSVLLDYQNLLITEYPCIDLSDSLVPKYLAGIPIDPKEGTSENSYYAVRKSENNRITVVSCDAEIVDNLSITQ
jgi:type II secretory pathway pseudopilin PulG